MSADAVEIVENATGQTIQCIRGIPLVSSEFDTVAASMLDDFVVGECPARCQCKRQRQWLIGGLHRQNDAESVRVVAHVRSSAPGVGSA